MEGRGFNMTSDRIKLVRKKLRQHKSLALIHSESFQLISYNTFITHVRSAGIDWRHEHSVALNGMKATLFDLVSQQATEKDMFDCAHKYLSRYEKLEVETAVDEVVDDSLIVNEILDDLK